jgi:hypothetical protein
MEQQRVHVAGSDGGLGGAGGRLMFLNFVNNTMPSTFFSETAESSLAASGGFETPLRGKWTK